MNKPYSIYQGIEDKRKIYVAVSAEIYSDDAIKIANQHFKLNKLCLDIEAGYTIKNDLYIGYSNNMKSRPVWVVTKKVR